MKHLSVEEVEDLFKNVFFSPEETFLPTIHKWFSPDFIQVTDGHVSNFDEFIVHVRKLRSLLSSISIQVLYLCQEDNKMSDRHVVQLTKKDGTKAVLEVLMLTERDDQGRIRRMWETARTVEGEENSEELARVR